MNKLSAEGFRVDLEIKKKLTELLQLKKDFENSNDLNPIEEEQNRLAIQKVDELIGRIRYNALDKLGIFEPENKEGKLEKDFPNMSDEQVHIQYPDLQVGKQPKLGERQKEIIGKGGFSPDSSKASVKQKAKDQGYDDVNIGGQHIGNVFQMSEDNRKPSESNKIQLDFNPSASDDTSELSEEETRILKEINEYMEKNA